MVEAAAAANTEAIETAAAPPVLQAPFADVSGPSARCTERSDLSAAEAKALVASMPADEGKLKPLLTPSIGGGFAVASALPPLRAAEAPTETFPNLYRGPFHGYGAFSEQQVLEGFEWPPPDQPPRTDSAQSGSGAWSAWNGTPAVPLEPFLTEASAARMSTRSYDPDRLLLKAARKGDIESMEIALKNGANPDIADGDGKTPLYRACCAGSVKGVELLIRHGANVNARDKAGGLPRDEADYWFVKNAIQGYRVESDGCCQCAAMLTANGGRQSVPEDHGNDAMMYKTRMKRLADQGRAKGVPIPWAWLGDDGLDPQLRMNNPQLARAWDVWAPTPAGVHVPPQQLVTPMQPRPSTGAVVQPQPVTGAVVRAGAEWACTSPNIVRGGHCQC